MSLCMPGHGALSGSAIQMIRRMSRSVMMPSSRSSRSRSDEHRADPGCVSFQPDTSRTDSRSGIECHGEDWSSDPSNAMPVGKTVDAGEGGDGAALRLQLANNFMPAGLRFAGDLGGEPPAGSLPLRQECGRLFPTISGTSFRNTSAVTTASARALCRSFDFQTQPTGDRVQSHVRQRRRQELRQVTHVEAAGRGPMTRTGAGRFRFQHAEIKACRVAQTERLAVRPVFEL